MSDTAHKYARGLRPLDQRKLSLIKTASDHGFTWPAAQYPIDLTGGVTNLGMGGNGPDSTQTIPGGPFGDCGPNAGPKNVDQCTAAMAREDEVAWTSDRTIRLYFLYQALTAGITWRPPALGATWTEADQSEASQLDTGVDAVDWLVWLATHDEEGNAVIVGQGLIDAFVKVTADELEQAAYSARAVMVAVNLNDQADAQFDAWQEGSNPAGWDVGAGDEPDPEEGHFIILGAAASVTGPYKWGSWGAFVPSTLAWRQGCPQVGFAVLTKEDVGQAFYSAAAQTIAEAGGTVPSAA